MDEFIKKYGKDVFDELMSLLINDDYNKCTDDLCDDEPCRLRKALNNYIKYRN